MTVSPELDNAREPARELSNQGFSLVAIARTLNVSVVSLLRWRQQDARMGRTWSSTGISQAGHPGANDLQTPQERQSALVFVLGGVRGLLTRERARERAGVRRASVSSHSKRETRNFRGAARQRAPEPGHR